MFRHGIAKRRGVVDLPGLPRHSSDASAESFYHTPPASRSSEPACHDTIPELSEDVAWEDQHDQGAKRFSNASAGLFDHYQYDATFFAREEDEREAALRADGRRRRSWRTEDDYGVAYSFYQRREEFSPPRTPEDERLSLDWESSNFRRGSLVLDPAAFDSSPSIDLPATTTAPPSPAGRALKFRRSAEALKDFGRKVLPRLKAKSRNSFQSTPEEYRTHKTTPSASSQPNTHSSSGRTRSNTVDSSRSARSFSITPFGPPMPYHDAPLREHLQDTSDVLSPLATYRSSQGVNVPLVSQESLPSPGLPGGRASFLTPSLPLAPHAASVALAPVAEAPTSRAPPLSLKSYADHPGLHEIMQRMQEEDDAFAAAEESMVRSGWSSENEINDLKQRRQEQQNLWQRRLDDALDQAKARAS